MSQDLRESDMSRQQIGRICRVFIKASHSGKALHGTNTKFLVWWGGAQHRLGISANENVGPSHRIEEGKAAASAHDGDYWVIRMDHEHCLGK